MSLGKFNISKFGGEDPFLLADLFTKFVEDGRTFRVWKALAFLTMLKLLKSRAARYLRLIRNGARSRVALFSADRINRFHCTFEAPAAIQTALVDSRNIYAQSWEHKIKGSRRLQYAL